jgi:AcrR family transcriptional regulator
VAAPTTLRADAARNLELILEAADEMFAEKGHEACVADIAARAGVGQATIFRRFETKDDLIAAVFERKIEQFVGVAEAANRKRRAWDGLMEFMATATELHRRDRGFFQSMAEQLIMKNERVAELKGQAKDAITTLVERAKAEGDLREDIGVEDIPAFCCAAAQAAQMGPNQGPRTAKRYLAVITDGMRAPA